MTKIKTQIIVLTSGIFLFSCSQDKEKERPNTFAPKVIETIGYVVPKDSISEPIVIPAGKPTIVKVGKPKVVPANTNIVLAGKPENILAGEPKVIIPGQDTFLLPKKVTVIDSPFVAGIPEVVIAKDAYIKDQNPENFSSFSKLQGLKHDVIGCMIQDKRGNLWFGTYGGGVLKYDGKSFTHFTEKEGLTNNTVRGILEDKNGNLWFGTYGGVSKYDGKFFTNFTEKEGLSNSVVWSLLEDKSGNLWFGTDGGGVSKYDGNRVEEIEAALQRGETISELKQQGLKKKMENLLNPLHILPRKKACRTMLFCQYWKTKAKTCGSAQMVEAYLNMMENPLRILQKKKASRIILFCRCWKTKAGTFGSARITEYVNMTETESRS